MTSPVQARPATVAILDLVQRHDLPSLNPITLCPQAQRRDAML